MSGILAVISGLSKASCINIARNTNRLLLERRCLHCGGSLMVNLGDKAATGSPRISELKERALLQIAGSDAAALLQGLITNDMEILNRGHKMRAMYAMFLNAQGRVLYDVLIYHQNHQDKPTYLVECDAAVLHDLHKHIRIHRLRKKADICDVTSEHKVWSVFDNKQFKPSNESVWIPDPRLSTFMHRGITSPDISVPDIAGDAVPVPVDDYIRYRYELGLAEGMVDLPPGESLPLESNLSFLNGVDFTKGCYLGQELTARTYHTGVIRKRIMPVELDSLTEIPVGSAIKSEKGRNAGKFRGQMGRSAIALLRIAHGKGEPLHVHLEEGTRCKMVACIPPWWPKDCIDHCQNIAGSQT